MKYIINKEQAGREIKCFLKNNGVSSTLLRALKKIPDGITVNGVHQNVRYVLKEKDILKLNIADTKEDENKYLEPIDIPIDVLFENDDITVVNKSAYMPTHESINNRGNSLANALAYRYKDRPYVFRATNRLDKNTSGIVITANNKFFSALLSEKIRNGSIKKTYIAIVEGSLSGDGKIEKPIGRIAESVIERQVREDGEYALTEFVSLATNDKYSVVLVSPKTGRTHQIRVHMSYIGHPLAGDEMYGGTTNGISRQALHCLMMDIDGVGCFYAPVADDMRNLIRSQFGNEDFIPKN